MTFEFLLNYSTNLWIWCKHKNWSVISFVLATQNAQQTHVSKVATYLRKYKMAWCQLTCNLPFFTCTSPAASCVRLDILELDNPQHFCNFLLGPSVVPNQEVTTILPRRKQCLVSWQMSWYGSPEKIFPNTVQLLFHLMYWCCPI